MSVKLKKKYKGRFIAFEGIDGSGKTTQVARLANRLRSLKFQVYETCEPTDSPFGSLIHQIMTGRIKTVHEAIAALFVADRIDHLLNDTNGIIHKIKQGMVILNDRYYFSSYAYQSPHLNMDWIIKANSISADILRPDLNIFIDIDPEIGFERINKERSHLELYENLESMKKVRECYFKSFSKLKDEENILIIDGKDKKDNIEELIWNKISYLF